jgi:chemotaxis protein MotB
LKRSVIKTQERNLLDGFNLPELSEFDPAEEKDSSWLITFVDILSLLITFFVLLLSFGYVVPSNTTQRVTIVKAIPSQEIRPEPPPIPSEKATSTQSSPKLTPLLSIPQNIKDKIDVIATSTKVNLVIKDDVLFAEGSAELTPLGRQVLDGVSQTLLQNDYPISVEGHTDNIPIHSAQFPSNWELSSFRATNVSRYFIQRGVDSKRISAVGYADTRPIADNDNAAGRALNRRVSLVIHVDETSSEHEASMISLPSKSP